ncbi:MAG: hypothetical protein WC710_08575 [Gallionella sp.]|jgi:hypothetical protein
MSIVTMNMSSYEIERSDLSLRPADEMPCPQLRMHIADAEPVTLPHCLVALDVDALLLKMDADQHTLN